MRKIILFAVGLLILPVVSFSQDHSCGFDSETSGAPTLAGFAGLKFFDEDLGCNPLKLKCNFVIIRRDDGTGGMPLGLSEWSTWEWEMNRKLADIKNPEDCATGLEYPLDSKVRVDIEMHTVDNTAAWDWYAEANADEFPSNISPNGSYICPRFDNSWTALEDVMTEFEQAHFGEINFFFIENGELIDLLETHLANGTEPTEPYEDRFAPFGVGLATGCSIFPQDYYSTASENSYVMNATYAEYLIANNFFHIWHPGTSVPPETSWNWAKWRKPYTFMHEMGHNILRMGHNNSCNQLMSTNYQRSNYIPENRLEDLHRNLATTDLHNAVICDELQNVCPVQAIADETIDQPMSVFGDLIVKEGVTLTVTSEIYFSNSSRVIVEPNAKFIVDGGLLTSKCGETWKGIKVHGGNTDFDVKITNGAVVENTSKAAVSMYAHEPWPEIQNFGNGILQADNSTFNNTHLIAEFMSWSPLPNSSYIRDCVQNGGLWSIVNWNCQGIEISDNVFNDIDHSAIVTELGSFNITGNNFNSVKNDILFNNVSAGISTRIFSNEFNGLEKGYNSRGTTFGQNIIRNNKFQNGEIGVMNDGHNQYNLVMNTLNSRVGSVSIDNGAGIADVLDNDFSGNFVGAFPIGKNYDYNFFRNCYSTTFKDNYIIGAISPVVHGNGGTADNCFTHQGNDNSNIQDIGGNPNPFVYIEGNDDPLDCRNAILADLSVTRYSLNGGNFPTNCGSTLTPGVIEGNYFFPRRSVQNEILEAQNWLSNKLVEIENDPSLSAQEHERFNHIYSTALWRVKSYLFEFYVKEGLFEDARSLYSEELRDDSKVYIFSSYIMKNDLVEARNYLNSIVSESEQMADFISIQNINLDRLPSGPFYEPSQEELNTVKNIAIKRHPYAAYGKALHYAFTGEIISSELPDLSKEKATTKSIATGQDEKEVAIYPNPFNAYLNIKATGYEVIEIEVSDFFGKAVYKGSTDQTKINLPTENWNQGVYLISIKSAGKMILTEKIVLLN